MLALAAILILVAAANLPIGVILIAPLEDRFPPPPADLPPPEGIIVLGGGLDDVASAARGETVFDEGGERLTEAVLLAKRYPQARIVYTGGSGSLTGRTSTEALQARNFMVAMGVAPERVTIEDKSRNTDENARFTAAIVHPQPSQRWLIVTSAFHMPRAMGVFEKAGFHPIAYPVALSDPGRGGRPARGPRSGDEFADFPIRPARVDRPCGLLGERADRPSVSRAGERDARPDKRPPAEQAGDVNASTIESSRGLAGFGALQWMFPLLVQQWLLPTLSGPSGSAYGCAGRVRKRASAEGVGCAKRAIARRGLKLRTGSEALFLRFASPSDCDADWLSGVAPVEKQHAVGGRSHRGGNER